MTGYLRPTAPIASDALLPADPGLAMALARAALVKPLMSNHHHGLWGYTGQTPQGRELTIQATGVGGPSAVAVATELAGHGVTRAIRIGRCAALDPDLAVGEVVLAAGALGSDGVSAALGVAAPEPDRALTDALASAVGNARAETIAGFDLAPADADRWRRERWVAAGAAAVDLETAGLLALGDRLGIAIAAVLVVSEAADGAGDEAAAEPALLALGERAALALHL